MTEMDAGTFYAQFALVLVGAIALAVAGSYFLRPRTRGLYPGGTRRYLLALVVQAVGFMAPIPVVLAMLMTQPIGNGLAIVLAVAAGFGLLLILRAAPVTGPLLRDLHRARVEAVMQRLERKP